MELKKLLRPRKLAIVGATEKETMAGFATRMFLEQCEKRQDDLYLVSRTNQEVYGKTCCKALSGIPEDIDLAVICTPKAAVLPLLEEAAAKGAKGAVVFASGYAETGKPEDIALEEALIQKAGELDLAVMGPNCAGFLNFIDRIFSFGFLFQARTRAGNVGLISQSGQVCMALMESDKVNFSYVISAGNSRIVSMEDYMEFLVQEEHTEVIAVYLEGIQNPVKFAAALRAAAEKKKPVVVLKAGRSEKGMRAAASHTGNLSGSDQHIDALLKKFGAIRVDDLEEMLSVCMAVTTLPALPCRNGLAFVNISGGETTISADAGSLYGLTLPDFGEETVRRLKEVLPPFATAQNPMDLTGGSDGVTMEKAVEIILEDPQIQMLVTGLQVTHKISDVTIYDYLEGLIRYCKKGNKKPVAVIPMIESGRDPQILERLREAGVPILPPPHYGYRVIRHLLAYTDYLNDMSSRTLELYRPSPDDGGSRRALSEHESKLELRSYGIPCTREAVAGSPEEAIRIAEQTGYPVVMKIESPDILHKTEAGGVRVGISCREEVLQAYEEILRNAKAYRPDARINGVLVQEMLKSGLELIVGVNNDARLGPSVLLGLGGIFTEIFRDTALYPAPLNRWEALRMIDALRGKPLLYGYRGGAELDVDALAELLVKVGRLAVEKKDSLEEMDLNPVFVYPKGEGVKAADALIVYRVKT